MPKSHQAHYFGVHALFIEVMKSREISKETSICQTRLNWWMQIMNDIIEDKKPREPVGVVLADAKAKTNINFNLLQRMIDY